MNGECSFISLKAFFIKGGTLPGLRQPWGPRDIRSKEGAEGREGENPSGTLVTFEF